MSESPDKSRLNCDNHLVNNAQATVVPAVVVPVDLIVGAEVLTSDIDRDVAEVQQAEKVNYKLIG